MAILKPSPGPPMRCDRGTRQPSKRKVARGCGRDHLDPLGDREAGRVRLDQEGREPAGAGRLAGAGEDDVEVGDAAVRDPGLHPVEPDVAGAVGDRGGGERGDVGAGLGLGEGEGGDGLACGDGRQDSAPSARRSRTG